MGKTKLNAFQQAIADALAKEHVEFKSKAATPITTSHITDASGVGLKQGVPDKFIDLVVDQSVFLKECRVFRTDAPAGDIAKIDISGYITETASENGTSTETRAHTPSSVPYVVKKTRSQFDITSETEEDNIEGAGGMSTILNALLKAVANDQEVLGIMGDDSEVGSSDYARLIKTNDGFNVLTASGTGVHQKNAGAKQVSWRLLSDMVGMLPTKYRRNIRDFRFIMSPNVSLQLKNEAQSRATGLGDGFWNNNQMLNPLGIPILEVPYIPEDLTVSGTDSSGTFIWLANPKNFIWVVKRDLKVHREFIPRYDRTEITVFQRSDFIIENTDAIVKATGVLVDPSAARYAAA